MVRCINCNLHYVNPCPTQVVLNDYYNKYGCNNMSEAVYLKRTMKEKSSILDSRVAVMGVFYRKNKCNRR